MQSPPGPSTVIDGRRYLYFVGTGYLGLQGHPELIRAMCEAAQQYGIGSATTRAGFGNTQPTLDVERLAAELLAAEAAFYLPSGYPAAGVLAAAVACDADAVFVDELSHYSVLEAARSTTLPVTRFAHREADHLRAALQNHLGPGQRPLVMTDGVFAARGRIAPLADYLDALSHYPGAMLLVDDAHALGVLGANGRGTFEHAGLYQGINTDGGSRWICGTLSKAVGGYGGIVPGTQSLVARLKSGSHWYDGASPLPAPVAAATARGLELMRAQPELRTTLWHNVGLMKRGLRQMGLIVDDTPVPIICLTLGTADAMRRIQDAMREHGILIAYMAAYSGLGPEGALRLAVFANHTQPMIEEFLDRFRRLV